MGLSPIPPVAIQRPPDEPTPLDGLEQPEEASPPDLGEVRVGLERLKAAHQVIQRFVEDYPEVGEDGRGAQEAILRMMTRFASARVPSEPRSPGIVGG